MGRGKGKGRGNGEGGGGEEGREQGKGGGRGEEGRSGLIVDMAAAYFLIRPSIGSESLS